VPWSLFTASSMLPSWHDIGIGALALRAGGAGVAGIEEPLTAALAGDVELKLGTDELCLIGVQCELRGQRNVEEILDVDGHWT